MTEILTNDRDRPIGPDRDREGEPRESFLKRLRFRRWVPALAAVLIIGAAVAWVKRPEQLPPTNVRDQVASIRSTPTKVWTSAGQVFSQNNGQRWIEAGDVLLAIGYTWGESGAVARSIVATALARRHEL